MNLPRLTAEVAVYRTCEAYRTDPCAEWDSGASVAPAVAAERIAGLEAVSDYINRMDLTLLKQKLTLPPSWGGQSWTAERAGAAETKYKKWLFLQRKYEDVALSPGPPGRDLDIFWHYHVLDTEAYIRDTAQIFGRYLHHPPDFGPMVNDIPQYTRRLFRAEYGEDLIPNEAARPRYRSPPPQLNADSSSRALQEDPDVFNHEAGHSPHPTVGADNCDVGDGKHSAAGLAIGPRQGF